MLFVNQHLKCQILISHKIQHFILNLIRTKFHWTLWISICITNHCIIQPKYIKRKFLSNLANKSPPLYAPYRDYSYFVYLTANSVEKSSFNFHICTVHLDIIKVLFLHHWWGVLKNNIKIYIKTAPIYCDVTVTPSSGSALISAYQSYIC